MRMRIDTLTRLITCIIIRLKNIAYRPLQGIKTLIATWLQLDTPPHAPIDEVQLTRVIANPPSLGIEI